MVVTSALEHRLQGKLRLPRGSRIARREARLRYHPERRAADRRDAARQIEIRLIEDVERLEAELQPGRTGQPDVLDNRQIGVAESRPDDRVAAEIPEVKGAARRDRERKDRVRCAR